MIEPNYKLTIPSSQSEVSRVEAFIHTCAEQHKLDDDAMGTLAIVATELVNNAILHGNDSDPTKTVELVIGIDKDSVSVSVTDEGHGFDANALPDPTQPENLRKSGGRGVYIVKMMAADLTFLKSERGLTVSTVIKRNKNET